MNPPGGAEKSIQRRITAFSGSERQPGMTVPGSVLFRLKASVFLGFQAWPMNNETHARIRRKQPQAHPNAPSKHTFTPSRRSSPPPSKCLDPCGYGRPFRAVFVGMRLLAAQDLTHTEGRYAPRELLLRRRTRTWGWNTGGSTPPPRTPAQIPKTQKNGDFNPSPGVSQLKPPEKSLFSCFLLEERPSSSPDPDE